MIKIEFEVHLISGDEKEWAKHDAKIKEIMLRYGGRDHYITYSPDGRNRAIQVKYPDLASLHNAGTEIRAFFRSIGIEQTVLNMSVRDIAEKALKEMDSVLA